MSEKLTAKEADAAYLTACREYRIAQLAADKAHQAMLLAYELWLEADDD